MGYTPTMEFYIAMKTNSPHLQATIWMNLTDIQQAFAAGFCQGFHRGSAGHFSGETPLVIWKCPNTGIVPRRQPAPPES